MSVLVVALVLALPASGGVQTRVDYGGFAADRTRLTSALQAMWVVEAAAFDRWSRAQQIAFLVNAYNAFTVELILTGWPGLDSIKDLGSVVRSPWKQPFFTLLGRDVTSIGLSTSSSGHVTVSRASMRPSTAPPSGARRSGRSPSWRLASRRSWKTA